MNVIHLKKRGKQDQQVFNENQKDLDLQLFQIQWSRQKTGENTLIYFNVDGEFPKI